MSRSSRRFGTQIESVERAFQRTVSLHSDRRLGVDDCEHIVGGLFVSAVASFEAYLEHVFVELVLRKSRAAGVAANPRAKFPSGVVLRDHLLDGRSYVDWLPYKEKTVPRAKVYLAEGHPFTSVSNATRGFIKDWHVIRNAIAHRSDHADDAFRKRFVEGQPLLRRERSPSGYLMGVVYDSTTRFENSMLEMKAVPDQLVRR